LTSLAGGGLWPTEVWRSALEGLTSEQRSAQEWPTFIDALLAGPNTLFEQLVYQLAWALREVAPGLDIESEGLLWQIWDRLQPYAFQDESDTFEADPVSAALNKPAGLLTQAL